MLTQGAPYNSAASDDELAEMFSRVVLLKEIGLSGLRRLQRSKVLVVGAGALGSTISELLARMGVGFIRIVDRDFVDLSNIPRVHLYGYSDYRVRRPKAYAVRERITDINPGTTVEAVVDEVDGSNVFNLIDGVDLVIDGLDNMETRMIVNEACIHKGVPYIFAGVSGRFGNVMPIIPKSTPCLRCILGSVNDLDSQNQCEVIGTDIVTVTMVSAVVAKLAVDILQGRGADGLYYIDVNRFEITKIQVKRNPRCPVCGLGRYEFLDAERKRYGVMPVCGSPGTFKVRLNMSRGELVRLIGSIDRGVWSVNEYDGIYVVGRGGVEITILNPSLAIVRGARDLRDAISFLRDLGLDQYISGAQQ